MSSYRGPGRGRGRGFNPRVMRSQPNQQASNSSQEQWVANVPSVQHTEKQIDMKLVSVSINLDLDIQTETWFTQFKNLWMLLKKTPSVTNMLNQHFETSVNPYEEALRLSYNCLDFRDSKPKSLSYMIMEEFKMWSTQTREKIVHLLSPQIKISAFNIVRKQRSISLIKLIIEVYEIINDCDMFLDVINYMIREKQYKEACQCATLLNLQDKFSIEDFLIPLLLQDKLSCVDDFLMGSPKHQMELVTFLDSILGQPLTVRGALEPHIVRLQIPEVKWEKLHNKPWRKLIARIVKTFNLSPDVSPFLNQKRNEGALQFLLHKRYIENSFGDESWKEMVKEAVKDDKKLQQELVYSVASYEHPSEALKWAHYFNVDRQYWPELVRILNDNPDQKRFEQLSNWRDETWDDIAGKNEPIQYHQFQLPLDSIHLVDNITSFESFLNSGLQDINIVGIDCEWKPSFGVYKSELSLMQIATRNSVFILDVIKLGQYTPNLWQELGKFLFNNCNILKLGFGFSSDISMIKQSLPTLGIFQKQLGLLDVLSLWKQIDKHAKVSLPYNVESGGPSLSTLVHQCCGHPLDKSDQFSNWENRPLRESQLVYAALDAYCLIQVYDVFKNCCETVNFPFDETCYKLMSSSRHSERKPKKHVQKHKSEEQMMPQPPNPLTDMILPGSLKVVCDTMLQGLGKSLRQCGVDVAILENNDDHMKCVNLAQDEARYILTKGFIFNKLCGYVPAGHCYRVTSDNVDEQLKQVLDFYNVTVTKDGVFSRCQICNSNCFVKLSKSTMITLVNVNKSIDQPATQYYADDTYGDEATGFSSDEEDYFEEGHQPPTSYTRKWELCADEKIDVGLCSTRQGVKIQVSDIPSAILSQVDLFYVCETCGKVYWDGSHFDRVVSGKFQKIVNL